MPSSERLRLVDEGQQVLGEGGLLVGIECPESLVHRAVVRAEHFDPVRRRTITEDEIATRRTDLQRGLAKEFFEACLGAP